MMTYTPLLLIQGSLLLLLLLLLLCSASSGNLLAVGDVTQQNHTVAEPRHNNHTRQSTTAATTTTEVELGTVRQGVSSPERDLCQPGMWRCWDGSHCIPENATCSGVADCPDESDENVAVCGCLTNEYQCRDECIDIIRRCDTVSDCTGGEDEEHCETWICPTTHNKCTNGFCVPSYAVCNFVDDCGDASDEHNCHYRRCYSSEFTCDNGECIRPGLVCEGHQHCQDGTDEQQCQPEDFAVCGSGRRVHRFFWCDGWPDCEDNHADELNCGECGEQQFRCPNSQCISLGNVCDAQCDCVDCADEQDCSRYYTRTSGVAACEVGEAITCVVLEERRDKDRCVAGENICDGTNHCYYGYQVSDERGCHLSSKENGKCTSPDGEKLFPCSDGRCIPATFLCDKKVDCLHGEDEHDCPVLECQEDEWQCASGQCVPVTSRCDLAFHCHDKSDEMNCSEHQCGPGQVKCHTGQCLPEDYWCDLTTDCPDHSDELNCGEHISQCEPGGFLCASGLQCISEEERCIVFDDRHRGCVDGSHLLDCKSLECPAGMFKCLSGPCLDASKHCNGPIDCPETWDDEDYCPFQCSRTAECRCQHLEADCTGLDLQYFPDIEENINRFIFANNNLSVTLQEKAIQGHDNILYLDLSRNHIQHIKNGTFRYLWRLRILILVENNLTSLTEGAFDGLHNLRTLHLNGNQITSLGPVAFYGLSVLPTLDLSHQRLSHISHRAFLGLRNLTTLSLSHNLLTFLGDGAFTGLRNLKKLDLTHNTIELLSDKMFHHVPKLRYLETDEWRLCCLARHVEKCLPEGDEFSSCEDLMSNLVLRVCIWILGLIALLGNSFVILWRSLYSSGNKMHSFLIVNLGVGDFLMGVYLIIVAVVDLQYRGVYAAYELSWRTSSLCQLAGFISTFSSELSVFTLTVITVDRLFVIKFPFGVRRMESNVIRMVMAGVWVLVAILSGLPLTYLDYFSNFYGRSGVCLALHITNEKPSGWEYAVFIFLVLNLLSFGVIAVSYVLMYLAARDTHTAARMGAEARAGDAGMARRMTLIVATDAACWLPIIFLGIASLCGVTIPPKVFSWIAVFVLPLNAAVNPVLYTLSTAPVRKRLEHARQSVKTRQWRSASAISGSLLASSFKARMATDLTDFGQTSDGEARTPSTKSAVCVYASATSRSQKVVHYVQNPGAGEKKAVNGSGGTTSLPLSPEGVDDEGHKLLCREGSSRAAGVHKSKDPGAMELVPLKELTTALPPTRSSSRKLIAGRGNLSDNRYN
ncbi:G-protein coupled receptor GRL101-like [Panulirus ornatus]|uniref:G-protein coupled receptor GRL101-like n=1 Tax=Panulirus ornatus TaxID=150431 RepID=UPI003A888EDD